MRQKMYKYAQKNCKYAQKSTNRDLFIFWIPLFQVILS
jgi:hypothetical protein